MQKAGSVAYRTLLYDALVTVAASPETNLSEAAVECALSAASPIMLDNLKPPLDTEGASLLLPLITALRDRGCAAKAAQYVLRYRWTAAEPAPTLSALVADMRAQGDFDGVYRLCAMGAEQPPHSVLQAHSSSDLLIQGLSEPRFVFDRGAATDTAWDLRSHLPLLTRWVGLAENFQPIQAVVGALLALTPPGLPEVVDLQLSTVAPSVAHNALLPEQQVSVLLPRLAETNARAALDLLRKW
jgi:hypothetical protein